MTLCPSNLRWRNDVSCDLITFSLNVQLNVHMYFIISITSGRGVSGTQFSYFSLKTCCGYSLEAPRQGASNEHHNICFHG